MTKIDNNFAESIPVKLVYDNFILTYWVNFRLPTNFERYLTYYAVTVYRCFYFVTYTRINLQIL